MKFVTIIVGVNDSENPNNQAIDEFTVFLYDVTSNVQCMSSECLENPTRIFEYAEALLQNLFPTVLNIGIEFEEVINLHEVVSYIESK